MGDHLSPAQRYALQQSLDKFDAVFQTLPGCTSLAEHRIQAAQVTPLRQAPYRIPHAYRDEVNRDLQEMLEHGIIEKSNE